MKRNIFRPRPSTRTFFREAHGIQGFSLLTWLHGYIYGRWVYLYIAIGTGEHWLAKPFYLLAAAYGFCRSLFPGRPASQPPPPTFADTYHGKVMPLEGAKKLVTLDRPLAVPDLEQVIPYTRARALILANPEEIVVLDCPCRAARPSPCLPLAVCLIIGEPFASFVAEHHPRRSRRITRGEALIILEEEHRRGHVHHAFFKEALLNRFYAICNCCACCCGAIQAWRNGVPMLASSGFVAGVDAEKCTHCGACVPSCQFQALVREGDRIVLQADRCLGCGVCVDRCRKSARFLRADPSRGLPLDIDQLTQDAQPS